MSARMFTEVDTGIGTVRTSWKKVRARVRKVNNDFFSLVDDLSPDNIPLYLVYLPYGQKKGDTKSSFFLDQEDKEYRLDPNTLPKEMKRELGYGSGSSPMGMVLEKKLEYYIDLPNLSITLPRIVRGPGSIFPLTAMFTRSNKRSFAPNGVLSVMSGCRSTFMAPAISSKSNYSRMQHALNLKSPVPEELYSHFDIFKELSDREKPEDKWRSCILYFSEEFFKKIKEDPSWVKVKDYLMNKCINQFEPDHYRALMESIFSNLLIEKNLKPNPYIIDTAKHIMSTTSGVSPGFAPARDESFLPLKIIEKLFIEEYGMKKYFPALFHLEHFYYEESQWPIYYSLQYPATHNFSPKSRTASSVLVEMRELSMLLNVFMEYLSQPNSPCYGTIFESVAHSVNVTCIHNKIDRSKIITNSSSVLDLDSRFSSNAYYKSMPDQCFPADGKFFRGCVAISSKVSDQTI